MSRGGGINYKAFLHAASFENLKELLCEVERIDNDDEAYLAMLREPLFFRF